MDWNRETRVTVVIVNWNGQHLLEECLEALRRQVYPSFSVLLVDNGSRDGSVAFVKNRYPEIHVLDLPRNFGFARANNLAIQKVRTDYVALLNNDAVADSMWLSSLVTALEASPEAGFAASKILFQHEPDVIDRAGDAYTRAGTALLRGRGMKSRDFDQTAWVFGACAGAALYRMPMLREVGLFDEDFFLLYEDVDLSFRAQLKGYKCLFVPQAVVYHKGSHSIVHDSPVSVYYSHRNLEWVYIQNMPSRLIPRTIFLHLLYDLAALCFFVTRGRAGDFFRAKRDALKGLKTALKKRRQVQGGRRAGDAYIRVLLDRPEFLRRLKGRGR